MWSDGHADHSSLLLVWMMQDLVWCLRNNYTFVALKLAWGEARRRECIPAILDRLSNEAHANFSATHTN